MGDQADRKRSGKQAASTRKAPVALNRIGRQLGTRRFLRCNERPATSCSARSCKEAPGRLPVLDADGAADDMGPWTRC